jgi:hypothetical protein
MPDHPWPVNEKARSGPAWSKPALLDAHVELEPYANRFWL